ncbi:hypothetical protein ACGK9U_16095, partial [Mariniflexile sp. HNIBRBA6329]
ITWTFTDSKNNVTSCTQDVVVTDNQAPTLTCPESLSAKCDISEQPAYATYAEFVAASGSSFDNCNINEASFTLLSEVSDGLSCPETVTRVYQIADMAGNTTSCTQLIIIDDEIAPIINTDNKDNVEIECGITDPNALQNWLNNNAGATASDNCSNVTWTNNYGQDTNVKCDDGAITVTFTATDVCGNSSTTTATYLIKDTTPPSITVPEDVTIECTADTSSAATGVATGDDDCSVVVITESDTEEATCGNTKIITRTWTATDACDNKTSAVQTITVVDTTPPSLTVPADVTI